MREIVIGQNEANKRLDRFLNAYFKDAGMGFLYKMLRKKNITLNGKKADGTEKLLVGDSIKVFFSDETFDKLKGSSSADKNDYEEAYKKIGKLSVIYEDENIVLVNKPAGVLSQKSDNKDLSLNEWLIGYLLDKGVITRQSLETYRPSICNRLDRNTSGLVICACSLSGARVMNSLIKERRIDKFYRTIVSGKVEDSFSLKGYLYKDEAVNKVSILNNAPHDERYSYIETSYKPVRYLKEDNLTLLEVKLITGKPHQIRAHLSSIGHPIIGDVKYGGQKIKGLNYQLLHSYRIRFPQIDDNGFEYLSDREYIADLPQKFDVFLKEG